MRDKVVEDSNKIHDLFSASVEVPKLKKKKQAST
jgi:hypothetical protein